HFDEAADLDVPGGAQQHRVGDNGAFEGRGGKARGDRGDSEGDRKRERPAPRKNWGGPGRGGKPGPRPWRGPAIAGRKECEAAAEADREPGHQPAGTDLDVRPFAHPRAGAADEINERLRPFRTAPGRSPGRRPPGRGPPAHSTLPDHRAAPSRTSYRISAMLHDPRASCSAFTR